MYSLDDNLTHMREVIGLAEKFKGFKIYRINDEESIKFKNENNKYVI